jgi:hypothetical protein
MRKYFLFLRHLLNNRRRQMWMKDFPEFGNQMETGGHSSRQNKKKKKNSLCLSETLRPHFPFPSTILGPILLNACHFDMQPGLSFSF